MESVSFPMEANVPRGSDYGGDRRGDCVGTNRTPCHGAILTEPKP
jgi:hypothetical protein